MTCRCDAHSNHSALAQARLGSGYDCGEALSCIQPDGSGYYIPTLDEVAGARSSAMQGHALWLDMSAHDTPLNPAVVGTSAAWGLGPSFDWLAATARRLGR